MLQAQPCTAGAACRFGSAFFQGPGKRSSYTGPRLHPALYLPSGCLTSLVGLGLTFFLSDGAVHAGPAKRTLSSKSSDLAAATGSEAEGGPSGERPASPEQPLLLGPEGSGSGTAEGAEADGGRAARER